MKRMIGLLMMVGLVVGVVGFGGCGGDKDSPTEPSVDSPTGSSQEIKEPTEGPQGQTLSVETRYWDNGNVKIEFKYYWDGGEKLKHGTYKSYYESGNLKLHAHYRENFNIRSKSYDESGNRVI